MAYDLGLALMTGSDVTIPECQITLHQPTIKEIALIGEENFLNGSQLLCINKTMISQGETLLSNTNNFQIFMMIMQEKEVADKKQSVQMLFPLLFPQYKVTITPSSLLFTQDEKDLIIDENNFEALQDVLRHVFCMNSNEINNQSFNPGNKKAQEIAEKLMRARQKIAKQKSENNGSIFAKYLSILTVGLGSMSLADCYNLTMYQLFDLVERYMLYVNWDLDIKSRLAGGKPDKPVENWMKDLH